MNTYITKDVIRRLREKENLTQAQLAEKLMVSDKAISKWENGKGLPDISLIEDLAKALNVSVIELMSGDIVSNSNRSNSMKKTVWYVCPACGNVIHSMGDAVISCCGITIPPAVEEEPDAAHEIIVERIEDEFYVHINHPMSKDHYISFIAYRTDKNIQFEKMYQESEAACHFKIAGHGTIFAYCNRHGLYSKDI